jgi:DNA-binding response OmpR family regulator
MKILFVENHSEFVAIAIREFFADASVRVAASVEQAKKEMATTTFDVILVDYDLEDGKGTQVIEHARRKEENTPIIAISSHPFGNQRLLASGADAVCAKTHFRGIKKVLDKLVPR